MGILNKIANKLGDMFVPKELTGIMQAAAPFLGPLGLPVAALAQGKKYGKLKPEQLIATFVAQQQLPQMFQSGDFSGGLRQGFGTGWDRLSGGISNFLGQPIAAGEGLSGGAATNGGYGVKVGTPPSGRTLDSEVKMIRDALDTKDWRFKPDITSVVKSGPDSRFWDTIKSKGMELAGQFGTLIKNTALDYVNPDKPHLGKKISKEGLAALAAALGAGLSYMEQKEINEQLALEAEKIERTVAAKTKEYAALFAKDGGIMRLAFGGPTSGPETIDEVVEVSEGMSPSYVDNLTNEEGMGDYMRAAHGGIANLRRGGNPHLNGMAAGAFSGPRGGGGADRMAADAFSGPVGPRGGGADRMAADTFTGPFIDVGGESEEKKGSSFWNKVDDFLRNMGTAEAAELNMSELENDQAVKNYLKQQFNFNIPAYDQYTKDFLATLENEKALQNITTGGMYNLLSSGKLGSKLGYSTDVEKEQLKGIQPLLTRTIGNQITDVLGEDENIFEKNWSSSTLEPTVVTEGNRTYLDYNEDQLENPEDIKYLKKSGGRVGLRRGGEGMDPAWGPPEITEGELLDYEDTPPDLLEEEVMLPPEITEGELLDYEDRPPNLLEEEEIAMSDGPIPGQESEEFLRYYKFFIQLGFSPEEAEEKAWKALAQETEQVAMAPDPSGIDPMEQLMQQLEQQGTPGQEPGMEELELQDILAKGGRPGGDDEIDILTEEWGNLDADQRAGYGDIETFSKSDHFKIILDNLRFKSAQGGRPGYARGSGLASIPKGHDLDLRDKGGFIPHGSKERADDVDARVSKNEFVMTADAVRAAGGGSINRGAQKMYNLMNNLEARVS